MMVLVEIIGIITWLGDYDMTKTESEKEIAKAEKAYAEAKAIVFEKAKPTKAENKEYHETGKALHTMKVKEHKETKAFKEAQEKKHEKAYSKAVGEDKAKIDKWREKTFPKDG